MLGLAGLPNTRDVLRESHESALRLFDELILDRLSHTEVNQVIDNCLAKVNENSTNPIAITNEGRAYLIIFSDGYPHFVQQFGYSAFDVDKDNSITDDDVFQGAFREHGAIEMLGERYYRDSFYNKIQQESYRQVLRIMSDKLDNWASKQEIRKRFKGDNTILNNALKALRDRHIIISKEGSRGIYRLQHKGFALWIKYKTTDPEKLQNDIEMSNN